RKRDPDHEHREQGRELLLRQTPERTDERLYVAREPGGHDGSPASRSRSLPGSRSRGLSAASASSDSMTRPPSRRTRRTGKCSSRYKSWLATSTVTPTSLKRLKMFITSTDKSGSKLPVGSSAIRSGGLLTTARAM